MERFRSVFWNKRKREEQVQKERTASVVKLFGDFSNLQFTLSLLAFRMIDHSRAEAGKIVAYVYYDIVAESLVNEDSEEAAKIISFMRDSALKKLDDGGVPQYRTYGADNLDNLSQRSLSHEGVARFLSENELFSNVLLYKVQELSNEVINSLSSREIDGLAAHLSTLLRDEELWQSLQEPINIDEIVCQSCHVSDRLEDINVREDSAFYMFKTDERQTKDDLEIFSLHCFKCDNITEFAADPYNFSQNAPEGIEYFRSYPVSKVIAERIQEDAISFGNEVAIEKIRQTGLISKFS